MVSVCKADNSTEMSPAPIAESEHKSYSFTEHNDLTSDKMGGRIVFATDDWFAGKRVPTVLT